MHEIPMFKRVLPALAFAVALSACGPAMTKPGEAAPAPPMAAGCTAAKAASLVGQTVSTEIQEQARGAAGASSVRTLRPGQIITKEYVAERLNLHVDEANKIVSVNCG